MTGHGGCQPPPSRTIFGQSVDLKANAVRFPVRDNVAGAAVKTGNEGFGGFKVPWRSRVHGAITPMENEPTQACPRWRVLG